MTRGGGSYGDGGDDLEVIEVVELEPSEPPKPRPEKRRATGEHRRRGPMVVTVVVVSALVASAIVSASHRSSHRRASTSTTDAGRAYVAPLFPFRVGAQIIGAGATGLRIVDTDTGRVTTPRITGLPKDVTIVAHSGGTVAVRAGTRLYWFAMDERIAHAVDANVAFPAAVRGYLWIAGPRFATLVPGPPTAIPTSSPAIGATRAGLLVSTRAGVLLQPTEPISAAHLLLPAPDTVIGVHADRVAWVSNDCGVLRCPVRITEIATGATSSWLQLVGRPNPLAVAGSSAVFSPGGNYLAIVVPDDSVTRASTLVVADLRTRATTVTVVGGRFGEPARPGSADATGTTVDWTLDGTYLVLAPAVETGAVGLARPGSPDIVPSGGTLAIGATAAVIGVSTVGPVDLPRRGTAGPIDTGGPTRFGAVGLKLVGADKRQVDVLDLAGGHTTTWSIEGPVPSAGPRSIARVVGGWLVVRFGGIRHVVDFLPDGGGAAREVGSGFEVFSSNRGRNAWIASPLSDLRWRVEPYDPATGTIGPATNVGTPIGAVDRGLLVTAAAPFLAPYVGTELDFVDPSGRLQRGPIIDSARINILTAGGTHVAFLGAGGLYLLDLVSGTYQPLATDSSGVALSPDGTALAWIDGATRHVVAMRVGVDAVANLGGQAERVLVADDGTVLFTSGVDVRRGRVDANGSSPVYGLAPDPAATLALG